MALELAREVSGRLSTVQAIVERAVAGMGYEPVDVEQGHEQRVLERVRARRETPMADRPDVQPRLDHHATPRSAATRTADINPSS